MKKVLILAYDFPPYVSVGGLRPYAWYKYLRQFGVEPIIVTRQWSNKFGNHLDYISASNSKHTIVETSDLGIIIRTPYIPNFANRLMLKYGISKYVLIRKIVSAYYELIQWFWNVGPKSQLLFAAQDYLKTNKVDAIIATGDPFILFKYASILSKEFDIPWIADYRDLWSKDRINSSNFIFKRMNVFYEKKTISSANCILTVSEFLKNQITDLVINIPIYIISNGYDEFVVDENTKTAKGSDILRLSFAGTINKWHPIESFLSVVASFLSDFPDIKMELNFYGVNNADELDQLIQKDFSNLKNRITIHPKLQNELLLKRLSNDHVMILFNDYSIVGTKIFDYLALKKRLLLCYENDANALRLKEKYYSVDEISGFSDQLQADIIKETDSGFVVKDSIHLRNLLNELYDEFTKNGFIQCNTEKIEQYSRKFQTEKLSEIIKNV
jgi:hypothetical protein